MDIEILPDTGAIAQRAAELVARQARESVAARGRFVFAVSGGTTPWLMLRTLARDNLPWDDCHVVQVDERVAPEGHADRNLTHIRESLPAGVRIHAMPVNVSDLNAAAATYTGTLREIAGTPPLVDLVHLGLGADGHTASLVPGDPVLDVTDVDVAPTGVYQGRRRLTLTFPLLNRARRILWLVTGETKSAMLARLLSRDQSIPAGRIRQSDALALADRAAAPGTL